MVTLKDIAQKAGVSLSTVSNALNGRKNIGPETRDRILAICEEMHYQPNLIGRSLKTGNSRVIMFNFTDFDRGFYLKIIEGISDYVYAKDYDLIICTSRSGEKFMNQSFTSGCITLDRHCSDSLLSAYASEKYPIISMDRMINAPFIKSVVVDNYSAQRSLMEQVIQRGFRSYAFLQGFPSEDSSQRYAGFLDALTQHGIPFKQENLYQGDYKERSGYQTARLIMLKSQLPEVPVCANDNMAIGAIKAFRENGLRVPEDISVTGFDDDGRAKEFDLTTVEIPNYERGYIAAQYLLANIEGAADYGTCKISTRVKWRSTVR